ncbi:MAG: restriction endonuclease subunit M [Betaproteobacteria bacterium]|jgi:type I restriction enzyme M protein|nr:MAG: restriction endonuclease subunit M [Betaproteobacteria bacterium]PZO25767.1 MAG: restriction endonuclease subunit M [Betaproteobacteria bacterium]
MSNQNLSSFIWSVADLLRGNFRHYEFEKIILPFTVLRRLDCVMAPTKAAVLAEFESKKALGDAAHAFLLKKSGLEFYNTFPMDIQTLLGDSANVKQNLINYVSSFSENVRDIFDKFKFQNYIDALDANNLLYLVVQKFSTIDMSPQAVSNVQMGYLFEELIRKFAEDSNQTAGEHFTPREVIRLMVNVLFAADEEALTVPGIVRTIYDPTSGTGGILSVAEDRGMELNPRARFVVYGQELNPDTYAICKADMLIKGQDIANIICGNTLSEDGLPDKKFDYMMSNPPFGVEWKNVQDFVTTEHQQRGYSGRFGPGLPRVSDGSLLFLLHLVSKMRPVSEGGSRIGIILNGSPLFTGGAESGESNIRRYLLEQDLVEAIIALPTDMFFNTGISTYIWILSNHKVAERKGKVQLINGADFYQKMRKSLGSKRKELSQEHIEVITKLYGDFKTTEHSLIFDNEDFGYSTITVERPLKLKFEITPEKLALIDDSKPLQKLEASGIANLKSALASFPAGKVWMDRKVFEKDLKSACLAAGVALAAAQEKAVVGIFGEHDDEAVVCTDKKGSIESNPDLRDTENVPLKDDIQAYFEREVLPHVPDAWIDHDKTKVGYEIPFNRHFYKYVPPRSLEEIDTDLKMVTAEIVALLGEVAQ